MSGASYPVWDLPVRVVHWSLVILVVLQYASGEYELFDLEWHMWLGEATLALLLFRILWGVFGSDTARFSRFVRTPREVLAHLRTLFRREPEPHAGHNPLGGWSVVLMLAALLLQAATGLFVDDDVATTGPFADEVSRSVVRWCTRLHRYGEYVLLGLIALHLAGVAWHGWFKRETLVRPMLTGRQELPVDPGLRFASAARALVLAAISAAAVWALVSLP